MTDNADQRDNETAPAEEPPLTPKQEAAIARVLAERPDESWSLNNLLDGLADGDMGWPTGRMAIGLGIALVAVCLVGFLISVSAAEQLLLGWLYFPYRVLPQVTVDVPSVVLGLVCAAMFVLGLHALLRSVAGRSSKSGESTRRSWSLRSTMWLSFGVLLLFVAGTSMVAATHQLVWVLSGRSRAIDRPSVRQDIQSGAVATARDANNRSGDKGNLKQVGLGMHNHLEVYKAFPPGGTMTADGTLLHGWVMRLAPYLDFSPPDVDYSVPWNLAPNDRICQLPIEVLLNASFRQVFDEQGFALSHHAGNVHLLPVVTLPPPPPGQDAKQWMQHAPYEASRRLQERDIRDGTSNTIFAGGVRSRFKPWGHPLNLRDPAVGVNRSPDGFGGPPGWGGAHFLLVDGSVRMVTEKADLRVMRALATPNGGERVENF